MTEPTCAAQHMGLWMARPQWLTAMVAAYSAGQLHPTPPTAERVPGNITSGKLPKEVYAAGDNPRRSQPLYTVNEAGVGVVQITGQMTKGQSSFGGTSNVRVRQAVRAAERDADVRGIMMLIDSPGGTVSGQQPMADEIARVVKAGVKPLVAHAEDSIHSAALWAGTQASRLTASAMTEVGSIGTVATVYDYSGRMERDGIKVHVISTGEMKGAFTPGTAITDAQLEELQNRVDAMNEFFLSAVSRGRKMSRAAVAKLADGRDWLAADAKELGLIDAVMSQEDAMASFVKELDQLDRTRKASARSRARAEKIATLGG